MRAPFWLTVAFGILGCQGRGLPDPRVAAQNFALAVEQGDADGAAAMMSQEAQTKWGKQGIRTRLKELEPELKRTAKALLGPDSNLVAASQAEVLLLNGRGSRLELEGDSFRIDFSSGLPARAKSPTLALQAFEEALALMPLDAVLLALSPRVRQSLEVDRQGLLQSLAALDRAHIDVTGDRATATLDGGYVVTLSSEDGLWFVEDFR